MGSEGQLRVLTVSDGRPFPVPSRREDTIGLLQSGPGSVTECRGKLGPVPEVGHPWGSQRAESRWTVWFCWLVGTCVDGYPRPGGAVTDDHRPRGLKQQKSILSRL